MGTTTEAYRRLPEATAPPDMAYEIDELIEEIASLSAQKRSKQDELAAKYLRYHRYLRKYWTQEEITKANQEMLHERR